LFAIGSGGMFGLGLGQSRQKLGFIPEAHNDIIFSIICEELGFVGAALVLFLFAVYIWRAIKIAMDAKDLYGALVATGIALMVGSQAIINIAVVTNSIPNTGVPLPFISHGGTSLAVMLFCTGILLNISRYQRVN
jgi:cell division protein FtsW